ncbi:N-6 DNA methylase [Rheinheimera sp. F8]|uniref:N-6 DNA methylase n=1 Tax=Rheinheimera sp. F8 TaxID=1763998 RepID=UPI000744BD6D|nr:N-6 DNA methylase [Rheinheimera sp. F8]ALZ75379.1 hypothetical protein ATY27_06175 [Rheinheimera sp. F8]ALZ75807.1 hypothetical protein ATY27_08530 [Rheinheimera sp. F8]
MTDNLNQYYTRNEFSDSLVNTISMNNPLIALDLGFGSGDLLLAAKRRWRNISLVGIDLDSKNVTEANEKKLIEAIHLDGFCLELPDYIRLNYGSVDLLLSNPPFYSKSIDRNCREVLKKAGLEFCIGKNTKTIPAEIIFLAQNIRLLTEEGQIGIILPAGLLTGIRWRKLRKHIFENYKVNEIIQLPRNSFHKTEAETFILNISMRKIDDFVYDIKITDYLSKSSIFIEKSCAILRADYSYHNKSHSTLPVYKNEDYKIFRGSLSNKSCSLKYKFHIHTSDLPVAPTEIYIPQFDEEHESFAKSGDILIARVGTRCIGRIAFIKDGNAPVSDCVIVIRPKNLVIGQYLWSKISSSDGVEYITNSALGVGAKYITQEYICRLLG